MHLKPGPLAPGGGEGRGAKNDIRMMASRNHPTLKGRRRQLRQDATPAERILWRYLRRKGLEGRKFKRQYSIGPYVVDFYCPEEQLVVELDGAVHETSWQRASDEVRTAFLTRHGIRVIRFENRKLFTQLEVVLEAIVWHFGREKDF